MKIRFANAVNVSFSLFHEQQILQLERQVKVTCPGWVS